MIEPCLRLVKGGNLGFFLRKTPKAKYFAGNELKLHYREKKAMKLFTACNRNGGSKLLVFAKKTPTMIPKITVHVSGRKAYCVSIFPSIRNQAKKW
jgi:hypothetical protein